MSSSNRPSNRFELSFRGRLLLSISLLILITGGTLTWLAHRSGRANAETLARRLFREGSQNAVTHTRAFVLRAEPLVESLRQLVGNGLSLEHDDLLARQLLAVMRANPGLSWVSFSDESGSFTGVQRTPEGSLHINRSHIEAGKTKLLEQKVLPDGTWQLYQKDEDTGYDPRSRPFYQKAKAAGRLVWLTPYLFFNQNVPGISCAAPLPGSEGRLLGVLSVDFDLNALSTFVAKLKLTENSTVFLFTREEILLAHPTQQTILMAKGNQGKLLTLQDTGDSLVEAFRKEMHSIDANGDDERFHFFEFNHAGQQYVGSTTSFQVGDDLVWMVGAAAPRDDFLGSAWQNELVALVVGAMALLLAVLVAALLANRVSGPVLALIGFMKKVGEGDLEARAELGGSTEFRELSAALNRMISDLRDRLRLLHSLNVAMEVQQRLLPNRPPVVSGIDLTGYSTYCDETGGDYYDFLVLDQSSPQNVLIALGDVMGHGIAAALVMAGVRAVLHDQASVSGLAQLLDRLNRLLAADHEGTRFMTMHLSVLNARSRMLRWVSAGHDPAILYTPETDRFEEVGEGQLPLGIMEETEYLEQEYGPLLPGQLLFIGTDGVWEMPNAGKERFGKDRLRQILRASAHQSAAEIAKTLGDHLKQFRGDYPPKDDVTFVVVKVTDANVDSTSRTAEPTR